MILQELEQGKKAWRAVDDLAKFDFQNSESNRLDTSDASAQLLHFQIKFSRHMPVCQPESRWWKIKCANNSVRDQLRIGIGIHIEARIIYTHAKCQKIYRKKLTEKSV